MASVHRRRGCRSPRSVAGGSAHAVSRGDRHGHDAMRRQPPRRHAGGGPGLGRSLGRRRHRDGGLDRHPPRRRPACGGRGAGSEPPLGPPRRLREPRRGGGPALRRLDPAHQSGRRRDAAGLRDERGTAVARTRFPRAGRRTGLRGGAQPEMAEAHHGAGPPLDQPDASRRLQAVPAGHDGRDRGSGERPHHRDDAAQRRDLRARARSPAQGGRDHRPRVRHRGRPGGRARRCLKRWRSVLVSSHAETRGRRSLRLDVLGDRAGPSVR